MQVAILKSLYRLLQIIEKLFARESRSARIAS
jgi:hypothetical protein